jgi:hypothetical protein
VEAGVSYRLLADMLVVFHLAVVAFVIAGATLVVWRKWIAWIHLPVVAWVIFAECFQVLCPLTYLENWLRDRGGVETYRGDFVAHYVMPVLYPDGLTARIQLMFGVMVFAINATLYVWAFSRQIGARRQIKARPEANTGGAPVPR